MDISRRGYWPFATAAVTAAYLAGSLVILSLRFLPSPGVQQSIATALFYFATVPGLLVPFLIIRNVHGGGIGSFVLGALINWSLYVFILRSILVNRKARRVAQPHF